MFNPGDKIRVKENGLTGMVDRYDINFTSHIDSKYTFWIWWDHDPRQSYSYSFSAMSEAEQVWELDGGKNPVNVIMTNPLLDAWKKMEKDNEGKEWRVPVFSDCPHDWADYQGFVESYRYCKKCDKKEA